VEEPHSALLVSRIGLFCKRGAQVVQLDLFRDFVGVLGSLLVFQNPPGPFLVAAIFRKIQRCSPL
jgi:hypothetical protein